MPHDHDHDHDFDGASPAYRRALIAVIVLNGGLFGVEMTAGAMAGSRALQADALDFAADALTYGVSLWAIGRPLALRARVAQLKGLSLALMALAILGLAIRDMMAPGVPDASVMGAVGFAALAANVASVLILMRWKDGDSNVRSVWLCSRNDAIGNVAVMGAAVMVAWLGSGWPDLVVAVAMAGLFLSSSVQILKRAAQERAHAH
ncbi:cation transporter [Pararhodobacter sp.]|uniref:cation transporter n=1 Tax=Pararhodobacter sp. TaxID=2127056 RepID=UPI002AFE6B25|nr:cation transporter [Pararhodobacter sp.]